MNLSSTRFRHWSPLAKKSTRGSGVPTAPKSSGRAATVTPNYRRKGTTTRARSSSGRVATNWARTQSTQDGPLTHETTPPFLSSS